MEPVPVTRTVHRTVRMAVVLVIGQALLCAVIGWIVFGHPASTGRPPGGPIVDRLAVPPMLIPLPPTATPPAGTATGRPRPAATATDGPQPAESGLSPSGRPAPPGSSAVLEPFAVLPSGPTAVLPTAVLPSDEASVLSGSPAGPDPASGEPAPITTTDVAPEAALVPAPAPAPPVPSGDDESLMPVRVDGPCRLPDEFATTADGSLVQCLPDGRDQLRWKIVEQR